MGASDPAAPVTLRAAVLAAAIAGCELEDCTEKAVVLYYVNLAQANVTNAYLAFLKVSGTVLYSEEDFKNRTTLFAKTLQEVANLNADLTDYFVSGPSVLLSVARLPARCPPVCSPAAALHLLHTCLSRAPPQMPSPSVVRILCCAAYHQHVC